MEAAKTTGESIAPTYIYALLLSLLSAARIKAIPFPKIHYCAINRFAVSLDFSSSSHGGLNDFKISTCHSDSYYSGIFFFLLLRSVEQEKAVVGFESDQPPDAYTEWVAVDGDLFAAAEGTCRPAPSAPAGGR
jgi:hypothetical protein